MKKSIIKTMCACSLVLAATACSEKQVTVEDDPALVSLGFQGKTLVIKDAVNEDNLVLKVYSRNGEALALCDESNFTFVSDSTSALEYDAILDEIAKQAEEILDDDNEIEGLVSEAEDETIDSTYLIKVIQINIENESELGFRFEMDLPNPYANNDLKNLCGTYKQMGFRSEWPAQMVKANITNTSSGLCDGMKIRWWDQQHPYAWDPSSGYAGEKTLESGGDETGWLYACPDHTSQGTMAFCNAPRKEKNRSKVSITAITH